MRTRILKWICLAAIAFLLIPTIGKGQNSKRIADTFIEPDETWPEFPGGQKAMEEYIQSHLSYNWPDTLYGRVFVQATFDSTGRITKTIVRKGINKIVDQEAQKVIQNMPKWKPATRDGKKISSSGGIPVQVEAFRKPDSIIDKDKNSKDSLICFDCGTDGSPEFPGGYKALEKYIKLHFEDTCLECIQGTGLFKVTVDASGRITEVKTLRGLSDCFNKEAIRMIQNMPRWKPVKVKGRKVKSEAIIPIKYFNE